MLQRAVAGAAGQRATQRAVVRVVGRGRSFAAAAVAICREFGTPAETYVRRPIRILPNWRGGREAPFPFRMAVYCLCACFDALRWVVSGRRDRFDGMGFVFRVLYYTFVLCFEVVLLARPEKLDIISLRIKKIKKQVFLFTMCRLILFYFFVEGSELSGMLRN